VEAQLASIRYDTILTSCRQFQRFFLDRENPKKLAEWLILTASMWFNGISHAIST
jgi:hypothetical protein